MNGAFVHTIFDGAKRQGEHILKEELGFLEKGIYLLVIRDGDGNTFASKWIKL